MLLSQCLFFSFVSVESCEFSFEIFCTLLFIHKKVKDQSGFFCSSSRERSINWSLGSNVHRGEPYQCKHFDHHKLGEWVHPKFDVATIIGTVIVIIIVNWFVEHPSTGSQFSVVQDCGHCSQWEYTGTQSVDYRCWWYFQSLPWSNLSTFLSNMSRVLVFLPYNILIYGRNINKYLLTGGDRKSLFGGGILNLYWSCRRIRFFLFFWVTGMTPKAPVDECGVIVLGNRR